MKLEIFEFIDKSLKLFSENYEDTVKVAKIIENFFNDSLSFNEHFSNVIYRIKKPESLKEKILRNDLYTKVKTADNLWLNLQDLIGVRLECRFIEEEEMLYQEIIKLFNVESDDNYFTNPLNPNIELNLMEKQPQIQKNGFEIYKIDGRYKKKGIFFNFELQIKSLVNVFWSEIEHKVLYKNFNYMITEDFFRDIMKSTKENLTLIDKQLMIVYKHLKSMDAGSVLASNRQIEPIISKLVHDLFISKIHKQTGILLDFKSPIDLLVRYMLEKESISLDEYWNTHIKLIKRISEISRVEVDFTNKIEIEKQYISDDENISNLYDAVFKTINENFKWNLFFKILFILDDNEKKDIRNFVFMLYRIILKEIENSIENLPISKRDKELFVNNIITIIINKLNNNMNIELFNEEKLNELGNRIYKNFNYIERPEDILDVDFKNFEETI